MAPAGPVMTTRRGALVAEKDRADTGIEDFKNRENICLGLTQTQRNVSGILLFGVVGTPAMP
jgi:hypothetical protein